MSVSTNHLLFILFCFFQSELCLEMAAYVCSNFLKILHNLAHFR